MKPETAKIWTNAMMETAIACTTILFPAVLVLIFPAVLVQKDVLGPWILVVYFFLWIPIGAVGFVNNQYKRTLARNVELIAAFRQLIYESLRNAEEVAMQGASNPRLARVSHGARRRHVTLFLSYATSTGMTESELFSLILGLEIDIRVMRDVINERNQTGDWSGPKPKWADALAAAIRDHRFERWTPEQAAAFEASFAAAGLDNDDQPKSD